ncbi:MAG: hypothetical protein A2Y23_04470 [Clostridiales bacterium GWB2_37_7]|nr:MAG: hypothetical protein A2Y23_04470 [Clostridiales bacterium GWB2_37_7]
MKRFMIGQYGSFDDDKYKRDFRTNFYGIEACMFENESDIDKQISKDKIMSGYRKIALSGQNR